MGNRLSKIYTRTGDLGETGLGDGSRIPKDSRRVDAMGHIDEFNAELEKKHGVEGFRGTQRALEEMAEKTAEIDQSNEREKAEQRCERLWRLWAGKVGGAVEQIN